MCKMEPLVQVSKIKVRAPDQASFQRTQIKITGSQDARFTSDKRTNLRIQPPSRTGRNPLRCVYVRVSVWVCAFGRGEGGCWHKGVFYCKVQEIDSRSSPGAHSNLDHARLVASSKGGCIPNCCRLDTRQATSLLERRRLWMLALGPCLYNAKVLRPSCRMTVLAATGLLQSAVAEITCATRF